MISSGSESSIEDEPDWILKERFNSLINNTQLQYYKPSDKKE